MKEEDYLYEEFKHLDFKLSPLAETIEDFDPSKINYTAVRQEIDEVLRGLDNLRGGKSFDLGTVTQLPKFLSTTLKYVDLKQVIYEVETSLLSSVSCTACKAGVGLLQHYAKTGKTRQEIAHAAVKLCINLKLDSKRVCVGIIHLFVVRLFLHNFAIRPVIQNTF
jgi:sphingomyelin phosphodiesterase